MQLLLILTLINAAMHSSTAKKIEHDVASTHAKDQLSTATDPKATTGALIYFLKILFLFPPSIAADL